MLSSQPQYNHHSSIILHHQNHRYPSSSSGAGAAGKPFHHLCLSSTASTNKTLQPLNPTTTTTPPTDHHQIHRKHNSKSTHLLHRHLYPHQEPNLKQPQEDSKAQNEILEFSLAKKRTPQFPGSIYPHSPNDVDVESFSPPIRKLFEDFNDDEEEEEDGYDREMLMKALEIRRNVTFEIFVEAMKKGKFGITYSTNLASRVPDFIDFVMIQAASMKNLPEFSQSSFNIRARDVIDNSNVVPLIRYID